MCSEAAMDKPRFPWPDTPKINVQQPQKGKWFRETRGTLKSQRMKPSFPALWSSVDRGIHIHPALRLEACRHGTPRDRTCGTEVIRFHPKIYNSEKGLGMPQPTWKSGGVHVCIHTIAQISHSTYRGENLAQLRNSKSSIFSSSGNGSQFLTITKFLCKSSPIKIARTQNKRLDTWHKVSQPDLTNSDGTCWDTPFQNHFKVREGQPAEAANILYSQSSGQRASEEATKAVYNSFLESS